jgi:hypothetical protein
MAKQNSDGFRPRRSRIGLPLRHNVAAIGLGLGLWKNLLLALGALHAASSYN